MWLFDRYIARRVSELAKSQTANLENVGSSPAVPSTIKELEAKIREQRRTVARLEACLHERNLQLDALHHIWCDGGCSTGAHRWTGQTITEEVVQQAERNTKRLRSWWNNYQYRNKMGWQTERPSSSADG